MRTRLTLLTLLCLLVAIPSPAVQFESKRERGPAPNIVYYPGTEPVTLSDGTGDRSLTVLVDGYGSFGSATDPAAGDATFDPIGSVGPAGTVYRSGVYCSASQSYLSTDEYGGLQPVAFTSVSATSATSEFDTGPLHVVLTQSVSRTSNGSILVQAYTFTNTNEVAESFTTTRYVDGDLYFDQSFETDFGGVSPDQRTLYEFDAGDDPSMASTFVGITDSGGEPAGFTIQPYPFLPTVLDSGGIPSYLLNQVSGDDNGDGVTDLGYDVTLSLASAFQIEPGQTAVYTSTTRFGDQSLTPRATIVWDAPDASSGAELAPPQHLRAEPLAASVAADPSRVFRPHDAVAGYNVYSSSTSPVMPGPSTFFTSVPAGQTSANVPTSSGGSFFVVTASYPTGESGASNEASADVPAATLTSVKVKPAKIVGKGSGFTGTVSVLLDGIPFASQAAVKGLTKVVQKGPLVTGQSVGEYVASRGGVVLVQFRNSNGGIAARRVP